MQSVFNIDNPLLSIRRTKIVVTMGPASSDPSTIEQLIEAGASVFRINMSHGSHEAQAKTYNNIRSTSMRLSCPVAVIADLMGPKIRVGRFSGGKMNLTPGQSVTVTTRDVMGGGGLIPSQYETLCDDVTPGKSILMDDGCIEIKVESVEGTEIACTVVHGGVLKNQKGINLPGVEVSAPSLTDKDHRDAEFAVGIGVDFLALSFVRRADDVLSLRELVKGLKADTHIIAKIERPEALDSISEILDASDGIMVARGDLGVEIPQHMVPVVQHELIDHARLKHKPVIIATQMLESMTNNPRPTRAEISDVSHATFSGADAVMLSAETAVGKYPVEAVRVIDNVARQVEAWQWAESGFSSLMLKGDDKTVPIAEAVARGAWKMSRMLGVRCLVVPSTSGATSRVISSTRPAAPIFGLTSSPETFRRMNLLWGVVPHEVSQMEGSELRKYARKIAREAGLASEGENLLLIVGFKPNVAESEPTITVLKA